jgi:hypothetical protein
MQHRSNVSETLLRYLSTSSEQGTKGTERRSVPSPNDSHMAHFRSLSFEAQAGTIRQLAATGMSLQGISRATGIAIEQLRRVIGERQ